MKLIIALTKHTELFATILIGIASVCIAYTTYTSGIWSGVSLEKYSKSNQMINEANTTYIEGVVFSQTNESDTSEIDAMQKTYEAQKDTADTLVAEADKANQTGDMYGLFAAVLAGLMFVISLATILQDSRIRSAIIGLSSLSLIVIIGQIVSLSLNP